MYEARKKELLDIENGMYVNRLEGREEGRQEGREEGRQEAHLETAKVLKALGTSYDIITKATGLTKHEIEAL